MQQDQGLFRNYADLLVDVVCIETVIVRKEGSLVQCIMRVLIACSLLQILMFKTEPSGNKKCSCRCLTDRFLPCIPGWWLYIWSYSDTWMSTWIVSTQFWIVRKFVIVQWSIITSTLLSILCQKGSFFSYWLHIHISFRFRCLEMAAKISFPRSLGDLNGDLERIRRGDSIFQDTNLMPLKG